VLLQLALDRPEDFAILPGVADLVDIVEVGTPLLKRFGVAAIATARELAPGVPVLADTKTVDGGALEADLVFGAGAMLMTVLSVASSATHAAVAGRAAAHGGIVVVDTITETGRPTVLPDNFELADTSGYVGVHSPTDMRAAGEGTRHHVDAVGPLRERGLRVAIAGGIGPDTAEDVVAAGPAIIIVGSAITTARDPREVTEWMRSRLVEPGRGWPWDAS